MYNDLRTDIEYLKPESWIFEKNNISTENDKINFRRDTALKIMKQDLELSLGIPYDDTTILNDVAVRYSETLKIALAYKQLELAYMEYATDSLSIGHIKSTEYSKKYNDYKYKFKSMNTNTVKSVSSKRVYL